MGKQPNQGERVRRRIKPRPARKRLFYHTVPHPFAGADKAEITEILSRFGHSKSAEFNESFRQLQDAVASVNPLLLLSSLSFYGLTSLGGADRELSDPDPLLQHHVELLQALALRSENPASAPPLPPEIQRIHDLARSTAKAFIVRGLGQLDVAMSQEERSRLAAIASIRAHTLAVRNWGYPHQILGTVAELFEPLDTQIERHLGVTVRGLVNMCAALIDLVEQRINSHVRALFPVLRAKSVRAAAKAYVTVHALGR